MLLQMMQNQIHGDALRVVKSLCRSCDGGTFGVSCRFFEEDDAFIALCQVQTLATHL